MKINKMESLKDLRSLKNEYMVRTTSALDGMWLTGFVPVAKHFGLYEEDQLIGYFCVNAEGYVLQYMLDSSFGSQSLEVFKFILEAQTPQFGEVKGAFCSTSEPVFLSICLDYFNNHNVNSLMYSDSRSLKAEEGLMDLTLLKEDSLNAVVEFANVAIGAPKEWLQGYYLNLINRGELYSVLVDGKIVATGECRGFDEYQTQYGDLGVMVSLDKRGKGIATNVLLSLKRIAKSKNMTPICSTTVDNLGAQKAIARAGFMASNRIIQFNRH